jgi:hypothetical protein
MAPRTITAEQLAEDGWLVKGTRDPQEALRAIQASPEYIETYGKISDAERASWAQEMLSRARPGHYRKTHCLESSFGFGFGWKYEIHLSAPGRGAFPGIMF